MTSDSKTWVAHDPQVVAIGHRGACGYRPEHTIASYELAIEMGADYIEPDLVMTKDGVLMVRHENEIGGTTDVSLKFPERKTTKIVDGAKIDGWFIEDFSFREMKTLKAIERLASRDHSYDGKFDIPTFEEVLALARRRSRERGRVVGVYPETKHPTYFAGIKHPLEPALIKILNKEGVNRVDAPIFIQSFEMGSLEKIKKISPLRLIFLLDENDKKPFDYEFAGHKRTYGDMLKPENLKLIAKTVYGIGPYKRSIVPENAKGELMPATSVITDAHAAGLKVHPYTFRSDGDFLNKAYKGDPGAEYAQFFELGVDGVFSDFSGDSVPARNKFLAAHPDWQNTPAVKK